MLFLTASIVNVSESSMFETGLNIERCATKNLPKMILQTQVNLSILEAFWIHLKCDVQQLRLGTARKEPMQDTEEPSCVIACFGIIQPQKRRHQANQPAQNLIIISSSRIPSSHIADNLPLSPPKKKHIYFPPNQDEIPLLAFAAPSSILRSAASIFSNVLLDASFRYWSNLPSAFARSARALSVCGVYKSVR